MKNITIHCILLLACAAVCTSTVILSCQCLKTSVAVKPSLISDVRVYGRRPYCNKEEVIVTLKDGSSRCLDPAKRFTQAILQNIQIQRAERAGRTNNKRVAAPAAAQMTPL